jgi:hypothetical protein
MTRTQDEIVQRIRDTRDDDWAGFRAEVLLSRLDFEHAREFLKPTATPAEWAKDPPPESVEEEARDYMAFAWGKAIGHRGISAGRSIDKIGEFLWLLGRDDTLERFEQADYAQYGAPALALACREMGWPIPEDEATQRMIRGEPCRPDCYEGCGR